MKIYKFKSINNDGFIKTLHLIATGNVYASRPDQLNDPYESHMNVCSRSVSIREDGSILFKSKKSETNTDLAFKIVKDLRIASFSASYKDVRMWAHYAESMTGVCLELEIDDRALTKVIYGFEPKEIDIDTKTTKNGIEQSIFKLFTRKPESWEYEQEYRALTYDEYVPAIVKRVIFGSKTNKIAIDVLSMWCKSHNIPFEKIQYLYDIDEMEIDPDFNND
jgi:hypothetical protein